MVMLNLWDLGVLYFLDYHDATKILFTRNKGNVFDQLLLFLNLTLFQFFFLWRVFVYKL